MFKQSFIVFIKEMKCIIRDKKTFILNLILPFLLIPSILFVISFSMGKLQSGFSGSMNISMDNSDNSFFDFCKKQHKLNFVETSQGNYKDYLRSGKIVAYFRVDKDIDEKILDGKDFTIDIEFDSSSMNSTVAKGVLEKYKSTYQNDVSYYSYLDDVDELRSKLALYTSDDSNSSSVNISLDTGSIFFVLLVPTALILYCNIGSLGTANELGVGEKERCTLESLLSTGANRKSVIIGKLLATTLMGVISAVCAVLGLWIYLLIMKSSSSLTGFGCVFSLLVIITFLSVFFASLSLMISVYSKSYKEAQTYSIPIQWGSLLPTFLTYSMNVSDIGFKELCIPIFNVVCILKELLAGIVNFSHLIIVVAWLIIYSAVICRLMVRIFNKENVIFKV